MDDLITAMDDNMIDIIVFKQWVSVNRSTLEAVTKPANEFLETFCEKLELLLPHSFIAMQQTHSTRIASPPYNLGNC